MALNSMGCGSATRSMVPRGYAYDGGEPGRQDPQEFENASVRLLICRLSTYDDVVPSITHRMLYWAARQVPGVYVDLAFMPSGADIAFLKRNDIPWLVASGAKQPPTSFDVVAFSISVPQEALNLPAAMHNSGLRLSAKERLEDVSHPLVILGGNAAGSVPFIHGDVVRGEHCGGLVDAVCFGDGLVWLQEFLKALMMAKSDNTPKRELLAGIAQNIPGTYVPTLYTHSFSNSCLTEIIAEDKFPLPVKYRVEDPASWTGGYDGAFIPFSKEEIEESLPLAIGCVYRCRFCQSGWMRGVLTETELSGFLETARRLKKARAVADLNLLASDACSVNNLGKLLPELMCLFPHVSLKSLAVASLHYRQQLEWFRLLEKHEFSLGVEGISKRWRTWLGKKVDESQIYQVAQDLAQYGLRRLKLFYIITGMEEEADWSEFLSFVGRLKAAASRVRVITSFTPLFHAPFTPLQFAALKPISDGDSVSLEKRMRRCGVEFRWSAAPGEIHLMNLLVRAGRMATPLLVKQSLAGTWRYYNQLPETAIKNPAGWFAGEGINAAALSVAWDEQRPLPCDDFESGTPRSKLWSCYMLSEDNATAHR